MAVAVVLVVVAAVVVAIVVAVIVVAVVVVGRAEGTNSVKHGLLNGPTRSTSQMVHIA